MRPTDPLVSVVCPMFREEATVEQFHARLAAALEGVSPPVRYEAIYVDDGSDDASAEKVRGLSSDDDRVKLVQLSRNFGHQLAITSGLDHATGDATVVIDTDLQDPPEVIPELVARWREGFDVVYAQRRTREGETLAKRVVSVVGSELIRRIAEVEIPPNTGDFRLMTRRVVDHVVALNEAHGFLRGLVALVGYRQTSVLYDRDARAAGDSKYNRFVGSILIGMNGIVSFSRYPLHVISLLGVLLSGGAFLFAVAYFAAKVAGVAFPTGNPTIVIVVSLFSGIQLLSLGIMGEYVGRIYDEVKRRPLYVVRDRVNFSRDMTRPVGDERRGPAPQAPSLPGPRA
jgi:polyisoprenyl-phosphate glycosyltransferase